MRPQREPINWGIERSSSLVSDRYGGLGITGNIMETKSEEKSYVKRSAEFEEGQNKETQLY